MPFPYLLPVPSDVPVSPICVLRSCLADATCECFENFQGNACNEEVVFLTCPGDCNGNGNCFQGVCECDEGYSGIGWYVLQSGWSGDELSVAEQVHSRLLTAAAPC